MVQRVVLVGLLVSLGVACGSRSKENDGTPQATASGSVTSLEGPQSDEGASGGEEGRRVTLSCPTLPGLIFDVPVFPGWEPQDAQANARGGCRFPLSHPDNILFESPPMINVHPVFGADAGLLNRTAHEGGRANAVHVDAAEANEGGVRGGTAFDHSRWVDGYTRRSAQWDYVQLYDPGFVIRIRVDGGGQESGFDRAAMKGLILASARFQKPALYSLRALAVGATPLETWEDDRRDAVLEALAADGAPEAGYFSGALGSTGGHESLALWHETAFYDASMGTRGDPEGHCRTAVFEQGGIRLLRWQ